MLEPYRKLFQLLDVRERRQFWLLMGGLVFVAVAEVVAISSVLLLLNVLADPESITTNAVLSWLYTNFGFESLYGFQLAISAGVMVVMLLGIAVRAVGSYATTRYSTMRGYSISARLLASYLRRPYVWFLDRNSADIGKNVLSEVDALVTRVISPALRMFANLFVVVGILGFLFFVDPLVTVLCSGILGTAYALIYLGLREKLRHSGEEMLAAFAQRFRVAQEATGGIKDVKILGVEDRYLSAYATAARRTAKSMAAVGLMAEMPRFVLEALAFGTLVAMILFLLHRSGGDISDIVQTLGIIAYCTMRLLPTLQQFYFGLTSIRSATPQLEAIAADYTGAPPDPGGDTAAIAPLRLETALELSQVSFAYQTAKRPAIRDLTLTIPARTTVGIVGGTGAGKTTLVDLILGLLNPDSGEIRVDGVAVTEANRRAWQKSLGYVQQSIYLTDDTIAANIAFGVPNDQIDRAALERAARAAALHDFVLQELPDGYDTVVGERGVRLSGGQRQRIGIARALYRDPTLLIMDEATSALDNITERVVMEAVQNIRADKTVILIAHRLTTVQSCDTIFLMDKGRLSAQGTYDELVAGNEMFRRMATGAAGPQEGAASETP